VLQSDLACIELFLEVTALVFDAMISDDGCDGPELVVGRVHTHSVHSIQNELQRFAQATRALSLQKQSIDQSLGRDHLKDHFLNKTRNTILKAIAQSKAVKPVVPMV
jgi:hypothetical protein